MGTFGDQTQPAPASMTKSTSFPPGAGAIMSQRQAQTLVFNSTLAATRAKQEPKEPKRARGEASDSSLHVGSPKLASLIVLREKAA